MKNEQRPIFQVSRLGIHILLVTTISITHLSGDKLIAISSLEIWD